MSINDSLYKKHKKIDHHKIKINSRALFSKLLEALRYLCASKKLNHYSKSHYSLKIWDISILGEFVGEVKPYPICE